MEYDVIIIGGSASGMFTSIWAAKGGQSVLLLEKNSFLGRKILATGNGRCNLTNKNIRPENYHGADPKFVQKVIAAFDQTRTINYFESLGVILKEEDRGRIFPRTNQASTIVEALVHEIQNLHVAIKTNCQVKFVNKLDNSWLIKTRDDQVYKSTKLILATGGKAAHQFGSSGDGLFWSQKIGHRLTDINPALAPIETAENWLSDVQGLKLEAVAKLYIESQEITTREGDILFTHYGLSGPAVMSMSRLLSPQSSKKYSIHLDLIPEETLDSLDRKINNIFDNNGAKFIKNTLSGILPVSIVSVILKIAKVNENKKTAQISKDERRSIIKIMKNLPMRLKKIRPMSEAQVTSGGIDTLEINPATMESKIIPNLFFAGEIVDVDGDSGGFNLQWAWSSGYVAGSN